MFRSIGLYLNLKIRIVSRESILYLKAEMRYLSKGEMRTLQSSEAMVCLS